MDLPAGLAVAVGILVLLPLAALAVERRWHDPPRERWGIPAERLAAARNSPELVAYRRRIALGLDPRKAAVVDRAVQTGTAAPPELRAAAQEMADALHEIGRVAHARGQGDPRLLHAADLVRGWG